MQHLVQRTLVSVATFVAIFIVSVAVTYSSTAWAGNNVWSTQHLYGVDPPCETQSRTLEEARQCVETYASNWLAGTICEVYIVPGVSKTRVRFDGTTPQDCVGGNYSSQSWTFANNCSVAGEVWVWEHPKGGCFAEEPNDDHVDSVCIGNPCNPLSRRKQQTFVDYEGPGIRFTRSYRSMAPLDTMYGGFAVEGDGRLPAGWTHSYASRVILDSGEPVALFRPNGAYVEVYESSTDIYLATDGSGVQARGSGANDITVYLPDGSIEVYGYHSDTGCSGGLHRLDGVIDAGGRETAVVYDTECDVHPTSIEGPFGHTLELVYDTITIDSGTVARLESVEDPSSYTISYDYVGTGNGDATGQLEYVVYQDGNDIRYHYDDANEPGNLSGITDELGVRYATFAYDFRGYVASSVHIGGFDEWSIYYAPNGVTTATDANGEATTFTFQTADPTRRLIASATRGGETRTVDHENSGQFRLLESVDENGVTTTHSYNTYHLTSTTEADGDTEERLLEYDYLDDTSDRLTSVESPSVYSSSTREVSTTFDGNDLPETITISGYTPTGTSVSRTVTLDYNASGQVIEIDGPRTDVSDITTIDYYDCATGYECGQLESITNALSQT